MSRPTVEIVEQPAKRLFRFRYESEGRLSGALLGENSAPANVSFPKIKVSNYTGKVCIIVTCVDNDNRQHPHKLCHTKNTRKDNQNKMKPSGEYSLKEYIDKHKVFTFDDIGIMCVKKNELKESLKARQGLKFDPTKGGFNHMNETQKIPLDTVKLCFCVLGKKNGEASYAQIGCAISNPIVDKKSNSSLKIVELGAETSSVMGGERILLLCDKVRSEDIAIVFTEENADKNVIWREVIKCENSRMRVHHQYAISFQTPAYRDFDIMEPRKVFIQLHRPSDNEYSEPFTFQFLPHQQSIQLRRKRQRKLNEPFNSLANQLRKQESMPEKPKYVPNIKHDAVLVELNANNRAEPTLNPQPLINFDDDEKENMRVPQPVQNRAQNMYQQPAQRHVDAQHANYPCNTQRANDFHPYYYPPYPQAQGANDQIVDPPHAHMLHKPRPMYMLPQYAYHQQQQQQLPPNPHPQSMNAYADPNACAVSGYGASCLTPTPIPQPLNPTLNYIAPNDNNGIAFNKQPEQPMYNARPFVTQPNDATDSNMKSGISDLILNSMGDLFPSELMNEYCQNICNPTGTNPNDLNDVSEVTNSLEMITLDKNKMG